MGVYNPDKNIAQPHTDVNITEPLHQLYKACPVLTLYITYDILIADEGVAGARGATSQHTGFFEPGLF